MNPLKPSVLSTFAVLFLAACQTAEQPNAEFVGSVAFSSLATYRLDPAIMMGFGAGAADRLAIEQITENVVEEELSARGFERVDDEADFVVRPRWTKRLGAGGESSRNAAVSDTINTGNEDFYDSFAVAVEAALPDGEVFWRGQTPRNRQVRILSAATAGNSVRYAIRNFPERVASDPALPTIQ